MTSRWGSGARRRTRRKKPIVYATDEFLVDAVLVRVTYKNVTRTTLRVKSSSGPVEITTPVFTSRASLEKLVREKTPWILAQQETLAQSTMAKAAEASPAETKEWRSAVEALAPDLVKRWAAVIGVTPGKLAYRNMKSRWGSCQPATGRICLNTRLALYPPECLEYVVVHERCHLKEANHGPAFHALMDQYLPDWRARRAKLK